MIAIASLLRSVSMPDMFPAGSLKPCGPDRFKTKCVFHYEKTASMVVNLYNGVWYFRCFGCGENGNAINLVMHNLKVNCGDAIRVLADGREFLQGAGPANDRGSYELACDEPGCANRVTIQAKDVDYIGHTRAVAWDYNGSKAKCPRCVRKQENK